MIDLAALRVDTPACETLLHLNNAGASLMPSPVYKALTNHLRLEQQIGGYEAQDAAAVQIDDFYDAFSDMLGCDPLEIAYMESATKAWDAAFLSMGLVAGDRVIIHASTYASNYLALLQRAQRDGLIIDFAPSDAFGQIDVASLPSLVEPQTKLILLTHCPSQSGLIQPAKAVGDFARDYGLIYLLDACQSVGQMPFNVDDIGCHALTGTGRKFLRGPRGTGFLYMKRDLAERIHPPVVDNVAAHLQTRNQFDYAPGARRFESFERHVAGQIGLGRAVRYALNIGLDAIEARIVELAEQLRNGLSELPNVSVHDPGQCRSGIVSFSKDGVDVGAAKLSLRAGRINISTVPCQSILLDAEARNLPDMMRASVHAYNSKDEIQRFITAISEL